LRTGTTNQANLPNSAGGLFLLLRLTSVEAAAKHDLFLPKLNWGTIDKLKRWIISEAIAKVKTLIQFLLQSAVSLWLLWWGFWALLLPFNQYEDSSIFVPDCDTAGELFIALSIWIIWLTTALSLGIGVRIKFWHRAKMLWLVNTLAVSLSVSGALRYWNLVEYGGQLQRYCR
jgi:hypothetical protein